MAQTIISASTTAAYADFVTWSDGVLVDAGAIPATTIVYITSDGTTPTASNFNYCIPGGQVTIVANRQPKLNKLQYAGNGGLDEATNANGLGVTSQSVPGALWTSGYPTYVGVVLSTGTGSVGVEQR